MNGDPRKPEIAAAQTYFAIKTREAETGQQFNAIPQNDESLKIESIVAFLLEEVADLRAKIMQPGLYIRPAETRSVSSPSLTFEEKVYRKIQDLETKKPPTERDVYRYFKKSEQPIVVRTIRSFYMKGNLHKDTSGRSPRYRSKH